MWQVQQAERLPRNVDTQGEGLAPEARGALGLERSRVWLPRLAAAGRD